MKRAICFLMPILICISGCLPVRDAVQSEFCLQIQNEDGEKIEGAQVWLYLLETGELVDRGETDDSGICEFFYAPDEIAYEENGLSCVDYIAYVEADGYIPCQHYMTKIYDIDTTNSSGGIETIELDVYEDTNSFSMDEDEQDLQQAAYDAQVYAYCVENGKITEESPIYVLTAEDKKNLAALGIEEPPRAELMSTVEKLTLQIPIGAYCVDSHAKLDVTYSSRDKVSIKLPGSGAGANVKVKTSGETTRTLGSQISYPTFSCTESLPVTKTYYVSGNFARTTVVSRSTTTQTYTLKSIHGGIAFSSTSNCNLCGAEYNDAMTEYGACVPILDGGSVAFEKYADRVFESDVEIPVNGVSTRLAVKITTTSDTSVKYTPKDGYDLCLYERQLDSYRWHVASRPAVVEQ